MMIVPGTRQIAVRDLKPGDAIADDRMFGGFRTVLTVTQELGRDLRPWIAIRHADNVITPVDSWDSLITIDMAPPRGRRESVASSGLPGFVPPRALAQLIEAALTHRRGFAITHATASSGEPYVCFTSRWLPDGCDIPTRIDLTWHTFSTGTYRYFSGLATGLHHAPHRITLTAAERLITGEDCFYRRYHDPQTNEQPNPRAANHQYPDSAGPERDRAA